MPVGISDHLLAAFPTVWPIFLSYWVVDASLGRLYSADSTRWVAKGMRGGAEFCFCPGICVVSGTLLLLRIDRNIADGVVPSLFAPTLGSRRERMVH